MILRLSAKLGTKIGVSPAESLPAHENPCLDWSGHLFLANRKQYVLICNTASLYSLVLPGKGIKDEISLVENVAQGLDEALRSDGLQDWRERTKGWELEGALFSKALNRSVTGSMNDLVVHAKYFLSEEGLSSFQTSVCLNETPFSYLGYATPREVFESFIV